MKIAYLINQYPKVSHTFIRREILALERLGHTVQRIAVRGWNDIQVDPQDVAEQAKTQFVLQGGAVLLLIATFKSLISSPARFFTALKLALKMGWRADRPMLFHLIYLAEACQTAQWVQAAKSRHIHAHFGTNPAEVAMLAGVLADVPYSFTVHGPEEFDRPQFLKLADKIKHAKFVVAISSFGRSQLSRWIDFSEWYKVQEVHCGLEPAFYADTDTTLPTEPTLVCVGRLCEQKGQMLLIEAAKQLKEANIAFSLVLAGDGEMRAEIEQLIKKYQLEQQVKITGWISSDAVRTHILAAQALVLPSFAEGLPVVIMEAMALRRPVLTTYIAGIPELVTHGKNGWLFPAGSVDALVDAMKAALNTPQKQLQAMGDDAFLRVTVRHDIDTEAAKLAALFAAESIA